MKKIKPRALLKVPMTVDFEIGRVKKELREVLEINKGTILKMEHSEKNKIQVYINGEHRAIGTALRKSGLMFVRVDKLTNREG